MAEKKQEATLHRSFAYTDADGKKHYFTRENQGTITDVLPPQHLEEYAKRGLISFGEAVPAPEVTPTTFPASTPARGTVARPAASATSTAKEG